MSMRVNENLVSIDGRVHCVHCEHLLAEPGEPALQRAVVRRGDITKAGPQIWPDVPSFVRVPVEFRQHMCPGCFTALLTEVVAVEDRRTRETTLARSTGD